MEYVIGGLAVLVGGPMLFAAATRKPGQAFGERMTEVGDSISRGGQGMQSLGFALTMLVTLPVIGYIVFGLAGAVIGLLIGIGIVGAARNAS